MVNYRQFINFPFSYRCITIEGDPGVDFQTSPVPLPQKKISSRPNPTKKSGGNPVPFYSQKKDSHSFPLPFFFGGGLNMSVTVKI